jgi:hypothetical protein
MDSAGFSPTSLVEVPISSPDDKKTAQTVTVPAGGRRWSCFPKRPASFPSLAACKVKVSRCFSCCCPTRSQTGREENFNSQVPTRVPASEPYSNSKAVVLHVSRSAIKPPVILPGELFVESDQKSYSKLSTSRSYVSTAHRECPSGLDSEGSELADIENSSED